MKSNGSRLLSARHKAAFVAFFCLAIGLLQSCTQWTEEQKKRQSLPDFKFENAMGGELLRSDLPEEKPVTILFFDPDCSHCKTTVSNIVAELDQFQENTIVMISPSDRTQVIPYLSEKGLLNHEGVLVGLCTPQEFLDTFGTTETPTTLFYGSDWDLKMAYKGVVDRPGIVAGLAAVRD